MKRSLWPTKATLPLLLVSLLVPGAIALVLAGTSLNPGQKVAPGITSDGFRIGDALDLSGDSFVTGGIAGWVFRQNGGGNWVEEGLLTAPFTSTFYGTAVAIDGDFAAVSDLGDDESGSNGKTFMFERTGNVWAPTVVVPPGGFSPADEYGSALGLSGDTLLIGAQLWGPLDALGNARVYTRSGMDWNFQQMLLAADGADGDLFGSTLAVDGNTVIVGAPGDDDAGMSSGSAYIFQRSGMVWAQQAKLTASDAGLGDAFGSSVSIDGNTVVCGAVSDQPFGSESGSAYVFTRSGTVWTQQQKLSYSGHGAGDRFGSSVSVSGERLFVGAEGSDVGAQVDAGRSVHFERVAGVWLERGVIEANDADAGDLFGHQVVIDGDIATFGAPEDDQFGIGGGATYIINEVECARCDDAFEDNDSCVAAAPIGVGPVPDLYVTQADEDWYQFSVPANTQLTVDALFPHADGDVDLEIVGSCGGGLVDSSLSTNSNEQVIAMNNTAGGLVFFLRVFVKATSASDCVEYSLNSVFDPLTPVIGIVMDNTPVSACSGVFTDSGGTLNPYQNNELLGPKTFTPGAGTNFAIDFTVWQVEGGATCQFDALTIYDGPSTLDPVIGTFCGTTGSPGTVVSTHPTGALTFEWVSDGSVTLDGWEANLLCPAGNPFDDCSAAFALPATTSRNLSGTAPDTSASCDQIGGTDDHYAFMAPSNGTLKVDTLGSAIDTVLSVSTSCGGVELACNDDSAGVTSALSLPMTSGQSVVVRVAETGNPASTGLYVLNSLFVPNDNCGDAAIVNVGPAANGSLACTPADGDASCDPADGTDVWYSFTASNAGILEVTAASTDFDTVLSLYSGCAGAELACNDNAIGTDSFVAIPVSAGQVVTIRVAAVGGGVQAGDFTLDVDLLSFPPSNDDCANATLLPSGFQTVVWDNTGATTDGADATGFCDYGAFGTEQNENDVWFLWTPDTSGCVYISHFGLAGVDSRLTIYDSTNCPDDPSSIIACVDDEQLPVAAPFEAGLDLEVVAGTQYLIRTGTFSAATPQGVFSMVIAPGPQAAANNTSGSAQPGAPGCSGPMGFAESCNGDGGDQLGCTDCPCGNNAPAGTAGGCLNSAATSGRINASGSASVTAVDPGDLQFTGEGMVPSSFCVLTSGNAIAPQNAANPCFGTDSGVQSVVLDGLRCAAMSTQRHGGRPVAADGTVGVSTNGWGGMFGPPAGLAASGGFGAGQTRHFQGFYRELPGLGCLTEQNTTQAVTVTLQP